MELKTARLTLLIDPAKKARRGVRLMLCDLNEQPRSLIRRAQFDAVIGVENVTDDLPTALAALAAQR